MVRDEVVLEQRAESLKILAHIFVELLYSFGIHGTTCSEVDGTDEIEEIVEKCFLSVGRFWRSPQTYQTDHQIHQANCTPLIGLQLAMGDAPEVLQGALHPGR